jgi:hypothetical protein
MNIFLFFSFLNILENVVFLKILFSLLFLEFLWFALLNLGIIDKIYFVFNVILLAFKIIIFLVGISPLLYIFSKIITQSFFYANNFAKNTYKVATNLFDENFLLFLTKKIKRRSKGIQKENTKKILKLYLKIESFETLEIAFSRMNNKVDDIYYYFR